MPYSVRRTNPNNGLITIQDSSEDTSTDVVLFGRKKLEYGQSMNSNLLHILENFACHAKSVFEEFPDIERSVTLGDTAKKVLSTPIDGQLWYNKTLNSLHVYDSSRMIWNRIADQGDISINSGLVADKDWVPVPASNGGEPFRLDECVWIVSANDIPESFDTLKCESDSNTGNVTCEYTVGPTTTSLVANYFIVAIRGNVNLGSMGPSSTPFSMGFEPMKLANNVFNESIGYSVGDNVGIILDSGKIFITVDGDNLELATISTKYVKITSDLPSGDFLIIPNNDLSSPYVTKNSNVSYVATNTNEYSVGRVINFNVLGANSLDGSDEVLLGQVEFRII